jgi:hypothetical protein
MDGLAGYGLIGAWPGQGEALGNLLRDHRLNYTSLELCAGVPGSIPGEEVIRTASGNGAEVTAFVTAMRAREIVTEIVLLNANGPDQMAAAASGSFYQDWLDFLEALGPERLMILAISEPQDTALQRELSQRCTDQLGAAGFTIVGNGFGGRGDPITEGWTLTEWHHCAMWTDIIGDFLPPFVSNSDCRPLIGLAPSAAGELACAAMGVGAYFLIYELDVAGPRPDVIVAIGACIPEGGLEIPAIIGTGAVTTAFLPGIV